MKINIIVLMITCCLFFEKLHAQTQSEGKANNYQDARLDFQLWSNFRPTIYFFWGGSWDWWFDTFYSDYKAVDHRDIAGANMPLTYNIALATAQLIPEDTIYKRSIAMRNMQTAEQANNTGGVLDLPYSIYYQNKFKTINDNLLTFFALQPKNVQDYCLTNGMFTSYLTDKAVIDDRVQTIHAAMMGKASRIISYEGIQKDYQNLANRLCTLMKIINKQQNPIVTLGTTIQGMSNKTDKEIISTIVHNFKTF